MTVQTDRETDRILSQRISSKIPLPPEVCLSDGFAASVFFGRRLFYRMMGVDDHPIVRMLESTDVDINMTRTLNRASHLDRMAHLSAWLGECNVRVIDLGIDGENDVMTSDDVSDMT